MDDPSRRLVASWSDNAGRWTRAVREGRIASRRAVTDAAIVAAVSRGRPQHLLDLGCGEGWLARALAMSGAQIVGVDVVPGLVAAARAATTDEGTSVSSFLCRSYDEVVALPHLLGRPFDTIVCNFSLLDDRVAALVEALARAAVPNARLLIQTLHPLAAGPPYMDGWRLERFEAFGETGWTEMPWYFRTLAGWNAVLAPCWRIQAVEEPRAPGADMPASLLLTVGRRIFPRFTTV